MAKTDQVFIGFKYFSSGNNRFKISNIIYAFDDAIWMRQPWVAQASGSECFTGQFQERMNLIFTSRV